MILAFRKYCELAYCSITLEDSNGTTIWSFIIIPTRLYFTLLSLREGHIFSACFEDQGCSDMSPRSVNAPDVHCTYLLVCA